MVVRRVKSGLTFEPLYASYPQSRRMSESHLALVSGIRTIAASLNVLFSRAPTGVWCACLLGGMAGGGAQTDRRAGDAYVG